MFLESFLPPAPGKVDAWTGTEGHRAGAWGHSILRAPLTLCPGLCLPTFGQPRGCNYPGHGNGCARPTQRQWLGQSTWASPGDWLGSEASWEEVGHCFEAVWAQWNAAQCRERWVPGPAHQRELVYCFNDPTVDPPGNRPANERRQGWHGPKGSLSGQLPCRHSGCVV